MNTTKDIKKIMRIGKIDVGHPSGRRANIFIAATITDGNLSISGVVGPTPGGNAQGGSGQIKMEFEHRNPEQNDKRYTHLTKPSEIEFSPTWNAEKWLDLLDIWEKWHLNDMQAGCEHQQALRWTYEEHHNAKTYKGENCPVCGYSIGSKWLKKELPQSVIDFIAGLPNTDVTPAWV